MDCSRVVEKLSFYIDKEIDEHTLETVEAHLAHCPACRQEHAALSTLAQAASGIEAIEPPAGLRDRIISAARDSKRQARRCERARGLLSAWIDGELNSSQSALVSAHLNECEDCAAEVESLGVLAGTASTIEPVEPPASLRARIAAAVASEPASRGFVARLREAVTVGSLRWAGGAAAAGLTALVVISMFDGPQAPDPGTAMRAAQRPSAVVSVPPAPETRSAAIAAPVPEPRPAVTRPVSTARRFHRQARKTAVVAVAPPTVRMPAPPPAVKHATPRPVEIQPEPAVEAAVTEPTPEPEKIAVAPAPSPRPAPAPRKPDRPTLTRVATAVFADDAKEWVEEIKTEAVMRKGEPHGGFQLVTSRF